MENSSNSDENCDLGYEPSSSSMDQNEQYCSRMSSADSSAYCRTSSEISSTGFSEPPTDESSNNNNSCSETASPWWEPRKSINLSRVGRIRQQKNLFDDKPDDQEQPVDLLELETMKGRLSKLLLGEDMSGSGKGVCTALTISNSITNLYASVFGNHTTLEPLRPEKKLMWKREMNCLLSVCDYIVESLPTLQNLRDGTTLEVMASLPRTDIHINLPALRKLDIMLMNILESFEETEFWYVEQGSMSANSMGRSSRSFRRIIQFQAQQQQQRRKGDKWWLPLPCVPPSTGLSEVSIKHLKQKRDCANQIHKAALTINSTILADMEIPHSYITSLSKSGKATVGKRIYRHMNNAEKFYPADLIESLNISSEHEALELADRVEASMYIWRHKACISHSKSSWEMVKDFMSDIHDKNRRLAERAEVLLCCLKQRNPELPQTSLDTSKIQYNRDVGQAILESYSRVLEGLAFNIVAWIHDVLFVDKSTKNQH